MRDPRLSAIGVLPVVVAARTCCAAALVSDQGQRATSSQANGTGKPWTMPRTLAVSGSPRQ